MSLCIEENESEAVYLRTDLKGFDKGRSREPAGMFSIFLWSKIFLRTLHAAFRLLALQLNNTTSHLKKFN
jgi:hypothetical protein